MNIAEYDSKIMSMADTYGNHVSRRAFLNGVMNAKRLMSFEVLWSICENEDDRLDMMDEIMKKMNLKELSYFIREALSGMYNHEIDEIVPQSYKDYLKEQ